MYTADILHQYTDRAQPNPHEMLTYFLCSSTFAVRQSPFLLLLSVVAAVAVVVVVIFVFLFSIFFFFRFFPLQRSFPVYCVRTYAARTHTIRTTEHQTPNKPTDVCSDIFHVPSLFRISRLVSRIHVHSQC